MNKSISDKLFDLKNELSKIQLEAQDKGYSIDLERTLIMLEGNIMSIKYLEDKAREG
jgi:hypothetical protein